MTEHPTSGPPVEAPPPTVRHPRPPFQRHASDKVIAGVAGGLARSLELDAVVVRILLVVLAVTFPPVLVAYVAAAILVPVDGQPGGRVVGPVVVRDGGVGFWVAVAVVVVLFSSWVSGGGDLLPGPRLLPLVLVGVGVALWARDGSSGSASAAPPQSGWPAASASSSVSASVSGADGPSTLSPWPGQRSADDVVPPLPPSRTGLPPADPPGPPSQLPRPNRSRLGPVTLALALITAGVVAGLDVAGVLYARPTEIVAVVLLVLGMGLIVGSVFGRARWLTLVALLLLPPVVLGALVRELPLVTDIDLNTDVGFSDGVGERLVEVGPLEPLPQDVRLLAGSVRVDLTAWEPTDAERSAMATSDDDLRIDVGAGEVVLLMPSDDVAWQVWARMGLGEVQVYDNAAPEPTHTTTDAIGTDLEPIASGGPPGGPVLDVVVDVTLGQLTVHVPYPTTPQELS